MQASELPLLGHELHEYHQNYEALLAKQNEQLKEFTEKYSSLCFARRRCRMYTFLADIDVLIDEAEDLITRAGVDTMIDPHIYVKYTQHMREELQMLRASRRDIEACIQRNSCCQELMFYFFGRGGKTYNSKKRQ